MPLRRMTGKTRSEAANWQLAALLAFTAGVVDVTGLLGLRQFTSHMSGITATLAAELGTEGVRVLTRPAIVLGCFLAGAAFCAVVVNWERRRNRESLFAVPVAIEALLLAGVALFGGTGHLFTGGDGLQHGAAERGDYKDIGCGDSDDARDGHDYRYRNRAGQVVLLESHAARN
jgi:hypothetical protein